MNTNIRTIKQFNNRKGQRWLLLAFLILHTIASFYYISQQNITFDEPHYIEYSKRWLHGKPERTELLDDSKSPVVAICWVPRIVKQVINPNYQLNDYGRTDQKQGRYMMIVFAMLAAIYVYAWCRQLYGATSWLLPLLLLLFDPLFLAYSTLITTDLACGAVLVALLYHFRSYLHEKRMRQLLLAGVFTGIALVTKQSLVFVLFLLPVLAFIYITTHKEKLSWPKGLRQSLVFLGVMLLVINAAFYFWHSFVPLSDYSFSSLSFQQLKQSLAFLDWLPVPVPQNYIYSMDMLQRQAEIGGGKYNSSYAGVYLLGEYKPSGNFWYYYLVHALYKMPIGTLLLLAGSVVLFLKNFRWNAFRREYQFLVLPVVFFGLILSFVNSFQIGIRHLLLIYPLLFIGIGYLFHWLLSKALGWKVAAGVAVAYTFVSVFFYYPDLIPYTNELVTNKAEVYKKIYDTSIDYGQSDSVLTQMMKADTSYKLPTTTPAPGKYLLLMGEIMDYNLRDRPVYPWFQKMKADSLINHVILRYDIKAEDLRKAGL